jgi:hypothetical protein
MVSFANRANDLGKTFAHSERSSNSNANVCRWGIRSVRFAHSENGFVPRLALTELCRNLGDEARSGGVVCRHFDDLDAVFESDTCDNLRQVICAF